MSVNPRRPSTKSMRRRLGVGVAAAAVAALGLPMTALSASALLDPNVAPAAPHAIIVFPSRDFVHLDGYQATDSLTVQIIRGGFVVGTTLPFSPSQPDPKNPGTFMEDINHVGQPCWSVVTPDIRGGDTVRVLTSPTTGDQTMTAAVVVTQKATKLNASTVTVKGTADDPAALGGRIPINLLQSRIVANKQAFINGGTRTLRAGSVAAPRLEGTIAYDAATGSSWTATFPNLGAISPVDGLSDADRAVGAESRGQWLGRNPLTVSENTIFEFPGGLIFPGPALGCAAAPFASGPSVHMTPASDTGVSATDNITSNTLPTFAGATGLATATNVNLYVDGVAAGTAAVSATGTYSIPLSAALSSGPHTVTAGEIDPTRPAETMTNAPVSVTVDTTAPVMSTHTPTTNATTAAQAGNVVATFGEKVYGVSGSTFALKAGTAAVGGTVTYSPGTTTGVATLNPTATLLPATRYTATTTSGIRDLAGNAAAATSWGFSTGPRPTVTRKAPAPNFLGASRLVNVSATFSENVSMSRSLFTLRRTGTAVVLGSVVSYSAGTHVAVLNPSSTLLPSTRYTVTLSTYIKDADGNSIPATTWTFVTGRA